MDIFEAIDENRIQIYRWDKTLSMNYCTIVLCCDVHYDFRIKKMLGSSLPPVVCRRAHVLFTLFVFVCI